MSFLEFLESVPQTEYVLIHRTRYLEIWNRIAAELSTARNILELGEASIIAQYCSQVMGINTLIYNDDLRFPWKVADQSRDAVLAMEVLERLADSLTPDSPMATIAMFSKSGARNLFRESHRVLRPGGFLAVSTPNGSGIDVIGNVLRRRAPLRYAPHVREYAPAEVTELAEEAGFFQESFATFFAWNSYPDIDRELLLSKLTDLGYDMSDRGDDALFIFRRKG